MYQSRFHYKNECLSIAIDSLTGELLELVNLSSGENLIKNSSYHLHQPFELFGSVDGETVRLFSGNVYQISKDAALRPGISAENGMDGGTRITVSYSCLTDGEKSYRVPVTYTVELPKGKADTLWHLKLENHESGLVLKEVRFPCINGVYWGEDYTDNVLVYPYHAGIRIQNPVSVFAGGHEQIYWKWQEYRYVYETKNPASGPNENGEYILECKYSGNLSMTFLDYYGKDGGLYFANHDPEPRVTALCAATCGPQSPGMNFSFRHFFYVGEGGNYESPELVAALHQGDWHEGAARYRAFREKAGRASPMPPSWFKESPGLVAHYDFKYQNGGIVHSYKDIPKLLDEARALGLNHLLLAGWHQDGFDHGFPMYVEESELGTKEELKAGIKNVTERGGHVCFYINSRLANVKYESLRDFIKENAAQNEDGSAWVESYGNADLRFASMCINSPGWPEKLREVLRFITEEIGVDGVYLDQLAMAPPCLCHNREHGHAHDCWNRGYQETLASIIQRREEVAPGNPMSIIHEGVSDSYGGLSSGHLISTFMYHHLGAFPELYKYTYPEHILVDMLYPQTNMAMRPVHVGQASTAIINRAFATGAYYWVYDLAFDNTFTRDPSQYAYLKDVIALRAFWLSRFGHGIFKDTDGLLVEGADDETLVKRFEAGEGVLLACTRRHRGRVMVECRGAGELRAACYQARGGEVFTREQPFTRTAEGLRLELPDATVSLIWIHPVL